MSEQVFFQTMILIFGTVGFLGSLRFIRRVLEMRHERQAPLAIDGLDERLKRIEFAVESTALEVERISEANRFMSKLLAERSGSPVPVERPQRVITPH